jgi:hypothetical protein
MDLATVTGGLGAANHVLSLLKGVAEGVRASGKAEGVSQILDLQMALMDLLQRHQALISDNELLRAQVRALEDKLKDQGALRVHHGAYWRQRDDGSLDGPFSQPEWDLNRRFVRLFYHGRTGSSPDRFIFRVEKGGSAFVYVPEQFLKEHRVCDLAELKT